jgi:antitoxin component YwqK of YwqJK toxin-antitoxin module
VLLGACAATEPTRTVIHRIVPPNANGPLKTWWADGRMREDGSYQSGQRHGHVRGFHPDGSLAFEGDFEHGVPVGEVEHHYPGGNLAVSTVVEDGAAQGARREYYPGGALAVQSEFVDGVREGVEVRWHENGLKASEGRFANGEPAGLWQSWDKSGKLAAERWYWMTDGRPSGHLESVFAEGGHISVQTRVVSVDGEWRARVTFWHTNGRLAGLSETVNGVRNGLDQGWDDAGRKRHEGRFLEDQRHGDWVWWGPSGEVVRSVRFDHGVEAGASDPSG